MNGLLLLLVSFWFLSSCATEPAPKAVSTDKDMIEFSRYFSLTTCYEKNNNCVGPVATDLENANVSIASEKFSKAGTSGTTAFDEHKVEAEGIPFKSEIRITKNEASNEYYVYIMVRSGSKLSREGVVKTLRIKDLTTFKDIKVLDKPIKFKGGFLKAELTFGPHK